MKHIVLVISLFLIFITLGCTIETQTENQESKVETSSTKVNVGKEMSVHFIDVGQGDSILIQSPEGKNMLIDGGKKDAGKQVVSYLQSQGVDELDYVIATHPDADHIGGLHEVLNSISIRNFVDSGKVHTTQTYENMLQLILDKNIPFIVPSKGDTIPLDPNIEITVLNVGEDSSDNNEASIVLKVQYDDISFLLTGDADIGVEQTMLKHFDLKSTILKAGHHGSDTSSSEDFIREVQPKVTVLSYGQDNSYGHPNEDVVSRLNNIHSQVYATVEVGNIIVKTNGIDYTVSTHHQSTEKNPDKNRETSLIMIESKDVQEEIVGITNTGDTSVNLNGWKLVSVIGNQVFKFPNITLAAGKTIYITSGQNAKEGQDFIKWTNGQMWRNDGDAAQLINEKGEVVSEME
ncbi:MBL fold metallo-hydrolase [Psychrobacillus vulpis]|uniref:MBL fold metallo-hydrolase n=1 Tax=Psychrobacillus vulpis TaxID=2325572 RepID=A0A544TPJ9_9BACI|nr:lamin tail domain-containing protein [Psychrobacillus vulpis]TQR19376.1 MBL fold metallo-hydrolase [Psychrobacillus vulpis]